MTAYLKTHGRAERCGAVPWARIRGYQFGFYVSEPANEPPHVHVEGRGGSAKLWLGPVRLERSAHSKARTREILGIADEHEADFLEKWREQFGDR